MRRGLSVAIVMAFLAPVGALSCGCESGSSSLAEQSMPTIRSLMGKWDLTSIRGASVADMLGADMRAPNLEFAEDGRVSGFSGVNRVMSSVDLDGLKRGEFSMSPAAMTMMAGPEEAMDLERKFMDALHSVTRARIEGDTLVLSDADASSLLTFARGS